MDDISKAETDPLAGAHKKARLLRNLRLIQCVIVPLGFGLSLYSLVVSPQLYYFNTGLMFFWGGMIAWEIRGWLADREWKWALSAIDSYAALTNTLLALIKSQTDTLKKLTNDIKAINAMVGDRWTPGEDSHDIH